jgi:hypothetical protein
VSVAVRGQHGDQGDQEKSAGAVILAPVFEGVHAPICIVLAKSLRVLKGTVASRSSSMQTRHHALCK